nr:hypothetical protein [Tanacetum cinerariifolium]
MLPGPPRWERYSILVTTWASIGLGRYLHHLPPGLLVRRPDCYNKVAVAGKVPGMVAEFRSTPTLPLSVLALMISGRPSPFTSAQATPSLLATFLLMKYLLSRTGILGALLLLATACSKTDDATPAVDNSNDNLALGNPSGAVANTTSPMNYLLVKPQYTVGYNRDQGKPIWVSWHLGQTDLGSATRQDDFRADESLPSGWYQVKMSDYSSSGFDRGHNCPSADRTATVADNSATFLMSNMMPQAPNNNQQTWGNLEDYCRTLVRAGNELYIVCGSYGRGGTGSAGYQTTIASGRVTVPSN